MANDLQARKQELVREAIYDAAIDLFVIYGFNETTIEQIAEAAGISQRSFFRYFATKGDLLGYTIGRYGDALVSSLADCPLNMAPLEVVRKVAFDAIQFSISQSRIRQVIEIVSKNMAGRQAQKASLVDVENRLAEAYASRSKSPRQYSLEPHMMAAVTMMVADLVLASWYMGEAKDCSAAFEKVFAKLGELFSTGGMTSSRRSVAKTPRVRSKAK